MTEPFARTSLQETPLDVGSVIEEARSIECGAVASFVGTVRRSAAAAGASGKIVVALEYEAHAELADARMNEIGEEAFGRWELQRLIAIHRTGRCELGEATVAIACAAPHRGDALQACAWIIDTIKSSVPIWKREIYADGSEWVGAGA